MAYCSNCGQFVADGVKFCSNCGASIQQQEDRTKRPREAMRLAANKHPIKCKFVTKQEMGGEQ